MCGIAGIKGSFDEHDLNIIKKYIRHRGPDNTGSFISKKNKIALIHSRLSIQDLSDAGNQPMASECKRYIIIFNGEIYNFKELKINLLNNNYTFKSKTDTEVILYLFIHFGISFLGQLEGDFSIAIWDKQKEELLLARDTLGIKPLYYYKNNKTFIFSSEVSLILNVIKDKKIINYNTLTDYLSYLWIPGEDHLFKEMKKVKPGYLLIINKHNHIEEKCWSTIPTIKSKVDNKINKDILIQRTRKMIKQAVQSQLVSDVPVGAYLSGGLDSSSIVYFARQKIPNLECFTIKTNRLNNTNVDVDLPYAIQVAKELDVKLHVVDFDIKNIERDLNLITKLSGEPVSDLSMLNSYYICKQSKDLGIKVLLSGTGGDDIFSGYRRHSFSKVDSLIDFLPKLFLKIISKTNNQLTNKNEYIRYYNKVTSGILFQEDERIINYYRWLDKNIIFNLLKKEVKEELSYRIEDPILNYLKNRKEDSKLSKMLSVEQRFFLSDHNLMYTDRTSMANGIEVRVPFLHKPLLKFASEIPDQYKIKSFNNKWILRKAMEGLINKNIIYRKKIGFGVPVRQWINNELREMIGDLLSEETVNSRGIFDSKKIQQILEKNRTGRIDASYTIIALLGLEIWFRNFADK